MTETKQTETAPDQESLESALDEFLIEQGAAGAAPDADPEAPASTDVQALAPTGLSKQEQVARGTKKDSKAKAGKTAPKAQKSTTSAKATVKSTKKGGTQAKAAKAEKKAKASKGGALVPTRIREIDTVITQRVSAKLPSKIDVDLIDVPATHPRTIRSAEDDQALMESIRTEGLLQPIRVMPSADGERYTLYIGARRLDRVKALKAEGAKGFEKIDAYVDTASEVDALRRGLVEDVHKQNLTIVERAQAVATYKATLEAQLGAPVTVTALANSLHITRRRFYQLEDVTGMPEGVQEALGLGLIGEHHIRPLKQLATPELREAIAQAAATHRLTPQATAVLVKTANTNKLDATSPNFEGDLADTVAQVVQGQAAESATPRRASVRQTSPASDSDVVDADHRVLDAGTAADVFDAAGLTQTQTPGEAAISRILSLPQRTVDLTETAVDVGGNPDTQGQASVAMLRELVETWLPLMGRPNAATYRQEWEGLVAQLHAWCETEIEAAGSSDLSPEMAEALDRTLVGAGAS